MKDLLETILPLPTVSFLEALVHEYIEEFAASEGLLFSQDRFGNSYVTYNGSLPEKEQALVLTAHTDHPGFVVTNVSEGQIKAKFQGGLSAEYGDSETLIAYRLGRIRSEYEQIGTADLVQIETDQEHGRRITGATLVPNIGTEIEEGDMLLWDVTPFAISDDEVPMILARQCDDLIGVVTILDTLRTLARGKVAAHVVGLFTRAEEVGLMGASAAGAGGNIPDGSVVIALETSSGDGGRAVQGDGPIIRVGDAGSIFNPYVSAWMEVIAKELAKNDEGFSFQRVLMDAGSTEATAFHRLGYTTGALCVALGNWHNAGGSGKIEAENVSLYDTEALVTLLVALAKNIDSFESTKLHQENQQKSHASKASKLLLGQPHRK